MSYGESGESPMYLDDKGQWQIRKGVEMNREDLLLTDGELDNIGYPILPIGDRTGYKRVSQAQLDKVLKGNWVDKPDSEGWWCYCYLKKHWQYKRYGIVIFWIDSEGTIFHGDKELKPALLIAYFGDGKWSKAIVPVKE